MLDNFARSVQILITLSGNIEEQLKNVSVLLDNLANKKIVINTESINNLTGSANNAAKSINKISDNAKSTEKHTTSSFDNIKKSIDNVNDGIGNLVNSLAGIAIGGSISGLAWKTSAESTLYVEQIERAINSNKKLKISFAELEEFSKSQAEAGEGTWRANIKEYYSILMAGSKYIKGSSTEKLAKADYITDFWFANQELMKAQGFGSAEDLVRSSVRTTGKLTGIRRDALATALGVDPEGKEMSSAKSRMKYMMEKGEGTDMSEALSKRPWEGFATSLKSLKDSIGDSLVWPMNKFVQLLTGAVKLLNSIPGAGLFIGLAGGAIALVSTLTLLNGVLMPGLALLKQMVVWTNLHTAAEVKQMVVSKALIVTDWLGLTSKAARTNAIIAETVATAAAANATALNTGAIGMESVALEIDAVANLNTTGAIFGTTAARTAAIGPTMGLTGATTSLAAAEWAALSPLLLLAIPLIAIAGLLYLVETRTHVFSNALDKLSKTEMSKDLIQWLEDVGYWAGYAIDRLGSVIESDLFSKIDSLNSAYTNVKSGNILGILGLGNEKSSETKPSATSQLLGSVGGLPGTNLLTMTKIVTPLSLMQNHLEFIVNVLSWFKNFFSGGNPLTNIYNAIITSIKSKLPSWVGVGTSDSSEKQKTSDSSGEQKTSDSSGEQETSDSSGEQETSSTTTKLGVDAAGNPTPFDPNLYYASKDSGKLYKGSDILKQWGDRSNDARDLYKNEAFSSASGASLTSKSKGSSDNNTTLNITNNINPLGDLGAAANEALEDDIAKIKEKVDSGEPISSLTPDLGNPSGLAKITYTGLDNASGGRISSAVDSGKEAVGSAIDSGKEAVGSAIDSGKEAVGSAIDSGKEAVGSAIDSGKEALGSGWNALRDTVGFADGGFVQKTGFALVHSGEPIIPADVASSSRLQNILESIAYGGSSSNTYGDINVRINYTPPSSSTSSNMIVMDRISFEHMVSDIIAKRLRQLNGY
jgi:hypothetical protein